MRGRLEAGLTSKLPNFLTSQPETGKLETTSNGREHFDKLKSGEAQNSQNYLFFSNQGKYVPAKMA